VARLYPRALGSLFVASYDSQDYGGGIRTRLHTYSTDSKSKTKSKLCYDRRSVSQSVSLSWCQAPIWGLRPDFYLSESCGFVDVGRSLWRKNGSAVYNSCWSSPAQSFLGQSPAVLGTIFYSLRFETPPTWRARPPYLYPSGTGWPGYTPRNWIPFSSPPTTRSDTVEVFEPASTTSPRYIAPARTAQKMSLRLFRVLSLPGKQRVYRAVP
jgi:hypothetical protein